MRISKKQGIILVGVTLILAAAFWYGGSAPGLQGWSADGTPGPLATQMPSNSTVSAAPPVALAPQTPPVDSEAASFQPSENPSVSPTERPFSSENPASIVNTTESPEPSAGPDRLTGVEKSGLTAEEKLTLASQLEGNSSPGVKKGDKDYSQAQGMVLDPSTGKDQYLTDPVPEGKPLPVEPQNAAISDVAHSCTLSVRCDTILDNLDWLDPEKKELVPEDGVIIPAASVTFYEGESVFNLLQREMKKAKIHMEFENTPIYNSAYIEGINNLYEFDCGELSGWMYKVNDWFPNYGCSRYQLQEGDVIEWVYTCNLGIDVGGYYSAGG